MALAGALIGCASSDFGKRSDVKHYGGLCGDITEGFSTTRASVSESGITDPNSVVLRTKQGRKLAVVWNKELPSISSLDPQKVYTFDVIAVEGQQRRNSYASVFRISDDRHLIADLSRCSIHNIAMDRKVEDWIDGYDFSQGRIRPYQNSGIVHSVCGSGRRHVVWVCHLCRDAEQKQIDRISATR